ncbi:arylformamidase [Camelliibacillus cellulosilyticus]|uniref:Kynurenine formamidase n=1 Tax=Camelliibacillus cellulosilyticus TaxID=2174486 RepID=A0ABV9GKS0_9BACL
MVQDSRTIIDITQPLCAGIPVWPGDTPFSFQLNWTMAASGSVNVGQLTMSTHTGTHIDAPYHFEENGKKVMNLDVNLYVGKAKVIELIGLDKISRADLEKIDLEGVPRVLIRTGSWMDRDVFPDEITTLDPDVALFLKEKGVRLIGLDVPSVDPIDSKELPAHHALHEHDVHILEGAVLDHVKPGDYELIALPLALQDADGSPVRAVLRSL